jgi:hypothetical protein
LNLTDANVLASERADAGPRIALGAERLGLMGPRWPKVERSRTEERPLGRDLRADARHSLRRAHLSGAGSLTRAAGSATPSTTAFGNQKSIGTKKQ